MSVDPHRNLPASGAAAVRFREHVRAELALLLRVAQRLTGRSADAEKLVQETLVRAYRLMERFDERHPRGWLLAVLGEAWKDTTRGARLPTADMANALAGIPAPGTDARPAAGEPVSDTTLGVQLSAGLRELPESLRQVVLLVDVEGLSYEETAAVLGTPTGRVVSTLHAARRRLRKHLEVVHAPVQRDVW